MQRLPFVPARNSRHRIAVLSLYRALLRSANKIDVPNDVCQTTTKGPLAFAINKAFVKNRPYTSYRLVYASMTAGYKVLLSFPRDNFYQQSHKSNIHSSYHSSQRPKR